MSGLDVFGASLRSGMPGGQGRKRSDKQFFGSDFSTGERSYENPFVMHQILFHLLNPKAHDVMIIAFLHNKFFPQKNKQI